MESEDMKGSSPIKQCRIFGKAWERVLVVANGFQEIATPPKNDVPLETQEQVEYICIMLGGKSI
jgi:hypothetical protein